MRQTYAIMATLALLAALAAPAAAEVILGENQGVTTDAILGYSVYGNQMVGMRVRAQFEGRGEENRVWEDLGNRAGGVEAMDWSLIVSGDTFADNAWTLTNHTGRKLLEITIQSIYGGVAFDAIYDPPHLPPFTLNELFRFDTPGSERGKAMKPMPDQEDFPLFFRWAFYQDMVGITGDAGGIFGDGYYGDLFSKLSITFLSEMTYGTLTWSADTDFIDTSSLDIDFDPSYYHYDYTNRGGAEVVPLPGSVVLLGSGLLGLVGWRRFRKS